jgi:hypothetical protein
MTAVPVAASLQWVLNDGSIVRPGEYAVVANWRWVNAGMYATQPSMTLVLSNVVLGT